MRTLGDIFVQIFRNLWAHKLRSFLTMFGIAWGVGSLLLLVGVGEGFRIAVRCRAAEEYRLEWRNHATADVCFLEGVADVVLDRPLVAQ